MSDEEKVIIVTKGEDATFDIFLVNTQNRPVDLTTFTSFKFCVEGEISTIELTEVPNANGSKIEKVAPDVLGHLRVTLDQVDSALLRDGFGQDVDIEWGDGTTRKRKRLYKVLNVEPSLCS